MKTIFKRAAAAATGSALLLSQLAATSVVNINAVAADTTALDAAWVVKVPVEETLKVTAITDGESTVNEITSATEAGESQWNNDVQTAIDAIAGSGAVSSTASTASLKSALETALASTPIIDAATAAELAAGVADEAQVSVDIDKAVITVDLSEVGASAGKVIEEMMRRGGCSLKDDAGNAIAIDWSAFKVSGTATITATYDGSKTVNYTVTVTDETGTSYTPDTIDKYISKKFDEAAAIVAASAQKVAASYGIADFTAEMTKYQAQSQSYVDRAMNALKAFYGVSVSGTEVEQTYTDYLAAVKEAVPRSANQIDKKAPATASAALYNAKGDAAIDSVIASLNTIAGSDAEISIAATDLADILLSGYDYTIEVPNGVSADLVFSIEDDQNGELLAALQEIDPLVATVVSHKEITLNVDNNADGTGTFYYNVVRVIDKITKNQETTESTTTTTTTTSDTTTTTTTTTSSDTTTTTTTTTTSSDTTTTTTTTTTSSDTTTTTTTTTSSDTTTTTTTTTSSDTTTTTTTTTSDTTTTTTTTTQPTYELVMNAEGYAANDLVYWSEEEVEFSNSGFKATVDVYVNGLLDATLDVTNAYAPNATKPSDIEFTGFGKYTVSFQLTDASVISAALTEAGYDAEAVLAQAPAAGTAAQFDVILVLRGDTTLDNKIDSLDAMGALQYYADVELAHLSPQNTINNHVILKDQDGDPLYLPYAHYAADVFDGNGRVQLQDAQTILRYYADNDIAHLNKTWADECGREVEHDAQLHVDPLAMDAKASEFVYGAEPAEPSTDE